VKKVIIHTVSPGESVYSISRKYGVPASDIIEANGLLSPVSLVVGQAIAVPGDLSSYTVQSGDSMYSIARKYGISPNELMSANPLIRNPSQIRQGQTIIVPREEPKLGTIYVNGYVLPGIRPNVLELTLPYLTYLSIFSYQVKPDGSLTPIEDTPLIEAARAAGVAPMMVITNLAEGEGFSSDLAHTILTNEQLQNTLLDNVTKVLKEKNYFGLDIDFEYVYPYDRENYNNFLRKVSARLGPQGYTITTALAPKLSADQTGTLYVAHDYPVHGALVDHVILMTYEWGYTYGPAMAVAPIDQVEKVLNYAVTAIPSEKILMGMPNYGYDWTLPFVQGSAARSINNVGAVSQARNVGANIMYDSTSQAPFYNYYDSEGKEHEVWFDDARSIEARLGLVSEYDLGGVSYWTINRFFPQNWAVLSSMYDVRKLI
jgi:spore germination protein